MALKSLARLLFFCAAAAFLTCLASVAKAHDVPPSLVSFDIGRTIVDAELRLPLTELGAALSLPLTVEPERAVVQHQGRIRQYVLEHFRLTTAAGERFTTHIRSQEISRTNNPSWVSNEWLVMQIRAQVPPGSNTVKFALDYDVIVQPVVTHKALVYVRRDIRNGLIGETPLAIGLIAFQQTHIDIDGSAGRWWQGFVKLLKLGVSHIAEGTDHLLFLLVLLLPAPLLAVGGRWTRGRSARNSLWMIAKTVTGFTAGHSITLAIGALGVVDVPERPVEVLIAFSIVVSAVHAWRPLFAGKEVYLAAGFGLIHGLAFARTLAGLNFDGWTLGSSLLGFNLGIESMQLVVVACVMPCLLILGRTRTYDGVRMLGAGVGSIAAVAWIVERVSGQSNVLTEMITAASEYPGVVIALLAVTTLFATVVQRYADHKSRDVRARTSVVHSSVVPSAGCQRPQNHRATPHHSASS